jgi:type I restriction enzyme, S subunit
MAKGKKQSLTAEELLEQALISADEQVYEVPENWVWARMRGILFDIRNGTTIKQNKEGIGAKVTRIESIQNNQIDNNRLGFIAELATIKESDWYVADDIALSHINSAEHVGKTAIITEDLLPLVHGMNLLRLRFNTACEPTYFYFFSQSFQYKQSILERINMAVNQVSINQKQLGDIEIPLPPLAEQQRIVARIGRLFSKLDQAKELAQNALDSFEIRKAAILQKAFTGELTAKWRKENAVAMDSWVDKELGDVCTSLQYGTSKKSSNEGKVVVIRMGNLQDGEISWDNLAYTNDEEDIGKYLLQPGDVLFNRTNSPELVGKTSIYRGEYPAIFAGYIIRLRYDNQIVGEYLNYVMNSVRAKEYCNAVKSDGVNQSNINAKKIAAFTFSVPPLEEQQEIVQVLNKLLDSEKSAKEITDVIDTIEQMKKAILARAFRGELGTNDSSEESVLELLKEVVVTQY